MATTLDFEKWSMKEREPQKGKLLFVLIFIFIPLIGEIVLFATLCSKRVIIVPEIGINKLLYFVQAIIFKYILWVVLWFVGVPVFMRFIEII